MQFDWLLMRQDFPVLLTGNTQFLLPCDESRVSNGKKCLKVLTKEENHLLWLKNFLNMFLLAKVEITR
jgi:hypothetical protein